jgi:ketosteroid isomerase-like protein
MALHNLLDGIANGVEVGDGKAVAAQFTEDGTYHDVFYGAFTGRPKIVEMVEKIFHRDGADFRWDFHDPVDDGTTGYARYVFSFASKLSGMEGKRAMFEGVAVLRLNDGLIHEYREVADATVGLHLLGFAPERLDKIIGRAAEELTGRDEAKRHWPK